MTAVQQQRIVDKARDKALDSARARVIELEEALLAQGRRAASDVGDTAAAACAEEGGDAGDAAASAS